MMVECPILISQIYVLPITDSDAPMVGYMSVIKAHLHQELADSRRSTWIRRCFNAITFQVSRQVSFLMSVSFRIIRDKYLTFIASNCIKLMRIRQMEVRILRNVIHKAKIWRFCHLRVRWGYKSFRGLCMCTDTPIASRSDPVYNSRSGGAAFIEILIWVLCNRDPSCNCR